MKATFRSLGTRNYRLWAAGSLVSNVGTWMQRTAMYWLVLTELTRNNAAALGLVLALQSGPHVLLLPLTGYAADHLDKRKLLMATQAGMGMVALTVGLLTVTGVVALWQLYLCAFALGCISAFDAPARQAFVSELVGEEGLSNAVGLNSATMTTARMIGPAVAGIVIASVGTGWAFLINAISFLAVLASLCFIHPGMLHRENDVLQHSGGFAEGFRYVWARPDLKLVMIMYFLIGTFGLNFPIFISTMSVSVFDAGPTGYGLLVSLMALGAVTGALLAAGRGNPRVAHLAVSAALFGLACAFAAIAPSYWTFGVMLVLTGVCSQTFSTSANSFVQLSTAPLMRGRVMAIFLAIALGGTPIGAPIVGWIADHFGPRWALGVGSMAGLAAAAVSILFHWQRRNAADRI